MRDIEISDFYKKILNIKKEAFRLKLFPLKDGTFVSLPVAVIGKGTGPVIVVTSAMHGDEINGIYCNHLIYKALKGEDVEGKIILLPVVNPMAFNQGSRISSIDNIDMNRTFSFVKKRKPTEYLAALLFEKIILKADVIFDLHTGGSGEYLPLVVVMSEKASREAVYLNQGNIITLSRRGTSLIPNCEKNGITAFCIEMGRALKLNRDYCRKFFDGFKNFLFYKGVMNGEVEILPGQKKLIGKIVLPARKSGFFQSYITLGQKVIKGQLVGKIETLFEEGHMDVIAPRNGNVVYLRCEEIVGFGDSLVHIGF